MLEIISYKTETIVETDSLVVMEGKRVGTLRGYLDNDHRYFSFYSDCIDDDIIHISGAIGDTDRECILKFSTKTRAWAKKLVEICDMIDDNLGTPS